LDFPSLRTEKRANVSDDAGLIEMFTLNIDYFKSKQARYSQDHYPARSWVSPRIFDSGVRADLSRDHDQNPVSTFYQTLKTRESGTRKIWICSGNSLSG